eukprot:scaffold15634_cov33-Prasinocladus_malaysianus.AAC.1
MDLTPPVSYPCGILVAVRVELVLRLIKMAYRGDISLLICAAGALKEVEYIHKERRENFRKNLHLTDLEEIAQKIDDGENRLTIGLHYGIPYPRLHHEAPKVYKPTPKVDQDEEEQLSSNPVLNAKLKAALERKRRQE